MRDSPVFLRTDSRVSIIDDEGDLMRKKSGNFREVILEIAAK